MDQEFLDWIVAYHEGLKEGTKERFCLSLHDKPSIMLNVIAKKLKEWGEIFLLEKGGAKKMSHDISNDSVTIMAALKKHFAEQIEKLTTQQP